MKNDLLFLAALSIGVPIVADAAGNKTKEVIDTLKAKELQEVMVVSTRANKKTPMAFTNVAKEAIKSVNHGKDIPFLLALTPSVTLTSDAGNGIGYTTMRVRGTDPSRINITANGIPMNDAESSSLFWVNFGDFASSAQSIQIQRGVGTSTNGAGAFGATVNMLTENIGVKPYVGVDLSAGSYYSHKETVRFSTGLIKDHWGLQGRLSNIGSKGYLYRASTKLNSYFLQAGYFGDNTMVKFITFNGQEETYHAWNYASKYEQEKYGRRYNSCGEYVTADGVTHYYDNQTDNYHSQNYQLIWNQRFNPEWNLNVALHYTRGDGYYEEYKTGKKLKGYGLATNDFSTDLVRRKQMGNDFYGAIASVNYDNKKNLTANIGGGWNEYDGDHFGNVIWVKQAADVEVTPDFEYYRNNAKKTDFNVYGKVNYQFLPGLSAFVDLQYRNVCYKMQDPSDYYLGNSFTSDYIINEKYNFFNPKFGLNYDINANNKVYVSYAISHKEPVRNNFEHNYNGGLDKPRAERLNDLELGYQFQSRTFSAGANFYYMNYKDQFVLTGALDNIGEAITANLDKSYRLGLELTAAWKPVDWFQWDANATLSRNRVKNVAVTANKRMTREEIARLTPQELAKYDPKDVQAGNIYKEIQHTIQGETPLSFSPSFIFNNIFTFKYVGFKGSIQSQYVSDQYLTNTGFEEVPCVDYPGNISLMLKKHFTTNIDLSYTFGLKKIGMKDATVGITLYNLFNTLYDNNGWASPTYYEGDGNSTELTAKGTKLYTSGFAPSAPFNMMGYVSINF